MLSFKPGFSLSFFTFIKRLFSSSYLSAIRVLLSAYLRLLIVLPTILIPACASSSPAICMMYSAYKLNKQGDNIQPWRTPFPIWNQSVVPCPVLTVIHSYITGYFCIKLDQIFLFVFWFQINLGLIQSLNIFSLPLSILSQYLKSTQDNLLFSRPKEKHMACLWRQGICQSFPSCLFWRIFLSIIIISVSCAQLLSSPFKEECILSHLVLLFPSSLCDLHLLVFNSSHSTTQLTIFSLREACL